jgi:hypothetical protein
MAGSCATDHAPQIDRDVNRETPAQSYINAVEVRDE